MRDVKHNTVYYTDWHGAKYLVLYDQTRRNADHFIHIGNKTYATTACFSTHSHFLNYLSNTDPRIIIREADYIEDKWLRSCIEANMYVECPKDVINNRYQIF